MANLIVFAVLAVVILASAVFCVSTKRIMRAATALLFVLFGVAGLYFLLDYTFLGAAQISIYAGGITVMYVFAIQLVSKRTLQGLSERWLGKRTILAALIALVGLATVLGVFLKNKIFSELVSANTADTEVSMQVIGKKLMSADKYGYVLPFEFISVFLLALKYNTKIGRDGVGLSQGQKQRILIARAVYKNPDYIFLDEATNSLDANNERMIVEHLDEFYKGKTVVIVAHRLSTVKNTDQIVVLDKGKVVEIGNHETLTAKRGAYYNLVKNQLELGN